MLLCVQSVGEPDAVPGAEGERTDGWGEAEGENKRNWEPVEDAIKRERCTITAGSRDPQ